MSRPQRRIPGAQSSLLVPQVEAVRTASAEESEVEPTAVAAAQPEEGATPAAVAGKSAPQPAAMTATPTPVETVDKTYKLPAMIVWRSETAVLRSGAYSSMKAFVAGAMERELARLEAAFNAGEQYPPNASGFRRGRPLGS